MGKFPMNRVQHNPKVVLASLFREARGAEVFVNPGAGTAGPQALISKQLFPWFAPDAETPTGGSLQAARAPARTSSMGAQAPNARDTGRGDSAGSSYRASCLFSLCIYVVTYVHFYYLQE